jgi:glycosyltransferase involved in cell wall biosynthesis
VRLLLVSRQHHPTHGGIGTAIVRFLDAALAGGWSVELVTQASPHLPRTIPTHVVVAADQHRRFEERVARLRAIDRIRPYRYGAWSLAVCDALRASGHGVPSDFDAVEFVDCQAEGRAALFDVDVRARFHRSRFVVHAHTPMCVEERLQGADPARFGRSIYHRWEREALEAADGVVATSSGLFDELRLSAVRLDAQRTAVVPYPIERTVAPPATRRERTIVLVGAVQPRKGIDVWAKSLDEVFAKHGDVRAVLVGGDTPTSPDGGSMIEYARSLVSAAHRDRFMTTGALGHAETLAIVAKAALVVVPSRFESFSFAAAEALSLGTPLVVSDRTGIAEHVPEIETIRFDDVGAWSEAQCAVLSAPDDALRRARAVRELVFERCSPELHRAKRAAFLASLASPPSTAFGAAQPARRIEGADGCASLAAELASIEELERSSVGS